MTDVSESLLRQVHLRLPPHYCQCDHNWLAHARRLWLFPEAAVHARGAFGEVCGRLANAGNGRFECECVLIVRGKAHVFRQLFAVNADAVSEKFESKIEP